MVKFLARITDTLEHFWEQYFMQRLAGTLLVGIYLTFILLVEFNRLGILFAPFNDWLPTNHFYAVEIAFTLLLFAEVVSLVFALTRSFSRSVGIQLEILSLILLRDTFKQFTDFSEPIEWEQVSDGVIPMISDSLGALAIFIIVGIYYRLQQRRPITADEVEQQEFIAYKKVIALGLLCVFAIIGIVDIVRWIRGLEIYPFFETFYTVLIFTDVLMVLISLRYGISFSITFRNFGYAVVTVFIRLALIAPTVIGVLLAIGTALFTLVLTYAYNMSGQFMAEEDELRPAPDSPTADVPAA
jgi:hypothetical protein